MTWDMRSSWDFAAASSSGTRYPWIAAHHDAMPSMTCRPSASVSRTPSALVTSSAGAPAGA